MLPVAGLGSRFKKEGFKTYKALKILKTTIAWLIILTAILMIEKGFQNRELNLIYGAMDKTAFYPPHSSSFSRVADMVSADGLNIFILEKNDHNINVEFLKEKIIN